MTTSDKQWLFLQDVARLILYAEGLGVKLTGGELYRTKEQQAIYLEQGLSKTNNSNHLRRMAIDFNLFVDGNIQWNNCDEWKQLGYYWESLDEANRWGGNYKTFLDLPHFERVD
jgi:hypothetical protein